MAEPSQTPEQSELYLINLQRSLEELKRNVQEHETELEKLRSQVDFQYGSSTPQAASLPAARLTIMKSAFDDAVQTEPFLPGPDSVLPALLALRRTHHTITESQAYLASQTPTLDSAKRRLEANQAALQDQQLLGDALTQRLASLRHADSTRTVPSPDQAATTKAAELQARKRRYDIDTAALLRALNGFIDTQLGGMLAAEDLGGPVVGDAMDVDDADLAGGFTAQGRPKKARATAGAEDKRQRRLDEIWGHQVADGNSTEREREEGWGEGKVAGEELRGLLELLLNRMMEARGDGATAYVQLQKDSAATRFLIRSKVAEFHPRDATKIRLLDFGRELDD